MEGGGAVKDQHSVESLLNSPSLIINCVLVFNNVKNLSAFRRGKMKL